MNNLGQWRTLQPQSTPVDLGFLSNTSSTSAAASTTTTAAATTGNGASATGLGGVNGSSHNGFPRAGRQITKNPQTLFQNFPPCSGTSSNSATAMSSANFGGSVGFNSFANAGSNGAALLSPGGGGGTRPPLSMSGTLSGGANATNMGSHSFDFQLQSSTQQRNSPSFGCLGRNLGQFSSNASSSSSSTLRNGFDSQSRTSMINGFGQNGGGNLDRTMSVFDNLSSCSNNGFSRQMSMPSNLSEHNGDTSNGFARFSQNDFVYSNLNRGDNSPPSFVASSSIHEMKIGTWGEQAKPSMNAKPGGGMGAGGGGGNESFPQIGNFEIGTFQAPTSSGHLNRASYNEHSQPSSASTATPSFPAAHNVNFQGGGPGIRETGIIEKLLHSYGFIQCCDRQARLFFHFSQFDGNIEHLKIGDPVEFEMTYDRRTGKPIASLVSKIAPEVVLSEERVIGVVTTEAKSDSVTGQETPGRISYENRGECFFLPFNTSDVEGNVTLVSGHQVSFQVATMARSGNLVARAIRLENPSRPVKYQGVVNSIKESGKFGFIERSDVVREIFFHFTEVNEGEDICFGDDVEFTIQTRNGKEVACNISKLAPGTVVFEDVGKEYFRGQVLKPLDRAQKYGADGDALNGRIKYRAEDRSEVEVPFGEKDQVRDFTLKHGDWVKFVIAVDRRDKLQRATKIELLDESFQVSDERREQGTVHNLKDTCGYIKCAERDASILFYFSECLDPGNRTIAVGDECEFTVTTDPNQSSKLIATRIKRLTPGTVHFSVIIHRDVQGSVDVEPSTSASTSWPRSPTKSSSSNGCKTTNEAEGSSFSPDNAPGKILYELNGMSLEIPVFAKDYVGRSANSLRQGDIVLFDINQSKATKETNAVNVRSADAKQESLKERNHLGYIAALKDGFGFIETLSHEKEIFFHFSNLEGKAEKLEVGTEVEYTIYNPDKGGKMSAEGVRAVPKGTIPAVPVREEVLDGKVVRPLRSVNPDQDEYCGLIQVKSEEGEVLAEYKFGIASLANKKELLQVGDPVQFQIHVDGDFAGNVQATKEKLRALVEAMKGQFGFLSYEVEEGKKLFFHKSEVVGNELLQQGDEVEFVVVTNKRTGKHSACCVKKLSSSKRPERLISKLKNLNLEGKKIVVLRQPRGPDGSKGFQAPAV